jgi:hypothetical protein
VNVRQTVKVEREVHEVEIESGTLYIQILRAERKTYSGGFSGREDTEEIQGRVWLATDPQFEGDPALGFVKVRGRKYTIDYQVKKVRAPKPEHTWTRESNYTGGYRNEKKQPVDYQAKAWDSLDGMLHEALDKFAAEHPEWVKESTRLLFESEVAKNVYKATELRKEADKHNAEAEKWRRRLDELALGRA